jgi:hypothetical protein
MTAQRIVSFTVAAAMRDAEPHLSAAARVQATTFAAAGSGR